VDRALARLSEYQASHAGHFLKDLPAATRPRLIGVSTAAQPAASLKADSFGSYLSMVAKAAMSQQPPPADFAEFRKRVRARMTADGVDPDHPDRLTRRP
jgi:HopA1 effector protein family